jgi:hypothetical protein
MLTYTLGLYLSCRSCSTKTVASLTGGNAFPGQLANNETGVDICLKSGADNLLPPLSGGSVSESSERAYYQGDLGYITSLM